MVAVSHMPVQLKLDMAEDSVARDSEVKEDSVAKALEDRASEVKETRTDTSILAPLSLKLTVHQVQQSLRTSQNFRHTSKSSTSN